MLQATLLAIWMLSSGHHHGFENVCSCDEIRWTNGWCGHCTTGYVAGLEVGSYTLIDALDTHGHVVTPAWLECDLCRKASAENGSCARCGWGIVGERIYGSKLTYYLALAKPTDRGGIRCERGESHTGNSGWCESCGLGWVGPFALDDRAVYEAAHREYQLLQVAVETLNRCESCALACYYGSICPTCKVVYRDGQPYRSAAAEGAVPVGEGAAPVVEGP